MRRDAVVSAADGRGDRQEKGLFAKAAHNGKRRAEGLHEDKRNIFRQTLTFQDLGLRIETIMG
jgi:hypothetical protein